MKSVPDKILYDIRWRHLKHDFWQSETIADRVYFMFMNTPIVYQEKQTCDFVLTNVWSLQHRQVVIGISQWIGLPSVQIREMIAIKQYKVVPLLEFAEELWSISKNRIRKVVR